MQAQRLHINAMIVGSFVPIVEFRHSTRNILNGGRWVVHLALFAYPAEINKLN